MLWGAGDALARLLPSIRFDCRSVRKDRRPSGDARGRTVRTQILVLGIVASLLGLGDLFGVAERNSTPTMTALAIGETGGLDSASRASVSVWLPPSIVSHATSEPPAVIAKRHAVIVGIDHAPGATTLQGAVRDARTVEEAVLDYGFLPKNVTTLLDAHATRNAFLAALERLARETPPDGIAIVAVAAHSRIRGGMAQLGMADGLRVNASEMAERLQRVRAPTWVALSTCYAASYALPGIVGPNRIATFASGRAARSYEVGDAGSYMVVAMVRRAMIERFAPRSVESAFRWAESYLKRTAPARVPLMSDGIDGDLVLGTRRAKPALRNSAIAARPDTHGASDGDEAPPSSTPGPGRRIPIEVCGSQDINCQRRS